jgi:hypothetical protein
MKKEIITCLGTIVGGLLISAVNGYSFSSYGTNVNTQCTPVQPFTGDCTLCHVADFAAPTPAKTAYLAGGTTLTDFFCPCTDSDGDTYPVAGGPAYCGPSFDCNDADPAINPGAVENCTDGIDNNCDGLIDAQDPVGCPAVPVADINLNPAALDFGAVPAGSLVTLNTEIQNLGTLGLNVNLINLCVGTSAEFTWAPAAPFTVAPGMSQTLAVTYAPVDDGIDTGCLAISSNDPDEATKQLGLNDTSSILRFIPAFIHPDKTGGQ